ncbi:MAG: molecular chaperone TorD family protein [Candidatus Korarchaeota archaeon]|nr:molecular chaperone TorD family protein [Candidatus Korarchaeota archaeon]
MRHNEVAGFRSLAYKYFSELLDYPYDKDIEEFDRRMEELKYILSMLSEILDCQRAVEELDRARREYLSELGRLGRDLFQAEYVATFELGNPAPPCPPFEREYLKGDRAGDAPSDHVEDDLRREADILSELIDFYEGCGVGVKGATPDHLAVELEFLHYLTSKEFESLENGNLTELALLRKDELNFLKNHLLRWLDGFLRCVKSKGSLRTYAFLLVSLKEFVESDFKYLGQL